MTVNIHESLKFVENNKLINQLVLLLAEYTQLITKVKDVFTFCTCNKTNEKKYYFFGNTIFFQYNIVLSVL